MCLNVEGFLNVEGLLNVEGVLSRLKRFLNVGVEIPRSIDGNYPERASDGS